MYREKIVDLYDPKYYSVYYKQLEGVEWFQTLDGDYNTYKILVGHKDKSLKIYQVESGPIGFDLIATSAREVRYPFVEYLYI